MLGLVCLAGCETYVKPVEYESPDSHCRIGTDSSGLRHCGPDVIPVPKDVDILFVVDNSGSMGQEQGKLAVAVRDFVEELEGADIDANYRIGITTTDNSNPWCGATTTPEAGNLVLSSCRGRADSFWFSNTQGDLGDFDIACTDHCDLEPEQLDALMVPTTTYLDPDLKVRPWVESINGVTNLPEGVSASDALACFVPQGIDGCGFESHLESMYKALQRSKASTEASHGFVRDDAILAIIIVTDEADCSYDTAYDTIFDSDGDKLFWSDPDAEYPTSAVCWNAGVECSGSPDSYDECHAVNKNLAGEVVGEGPESMLRPVARYAELVQAIEDHKQQLRPHLEVIVSVIGGVPADYITGDLADLYADAEDPTYQNDFGIGPGCESVYVHPHTMDNITQTAVPPVRLREFAEAFGRDNSVSVCGDDYSGAFKAVLDAIRVQIRPACFKSCVEDTQPDEPGLQPECIVEQQLHHGDTTMVPRCDVQDGEYVMPTAEDDVCFAYLTDAEQEGDPLDDMADECIEDGWNLQFVIVRRDGVPVPHGSALTADCQLSETPTEDCPGV
jgi:hypothetical protein